MQNSAPTAEPQLHKQGNAQTVEPNFYLMQNSAPTAEPILNKNECPIMFPVFKFKTIILIKIVPFDIV